MTNVVKMRHYGVAAIACGIALVVARPLKAESSCFLLAIIVSSLFGGRGPGLLAVGLSTIAFDIFFLPAPLPLSSDPSSYLRLGVFLAAAITASQLIEAKKRIEETLRRTQARLSRATQIATVAELAASIAHEISQPLSAVVANGQACTQWLAAEPPNMTNARIAAERIVRDGKDAGEVVRRLRELFKKNALTKVDLDVNDVVHEVIRLIRTEVVRKRITVETDLEKKLPFVQGDRVQLQQVIFNLLLNGIEAMEAVNDRPRKLWICSKLRGGDAIVVEIRDHGSGLADAEKVFEAFYTTKEKGMGMGLAICRSIVEAHGGLLGISPSHGPGTTFFFTLPLESSQST
ncbi:sensor histidine kinase [Alloacidobacterium dinghuense]|uniref:histidine kinase n=1 Tax=Alloacidobacterium dinghuense TaxID=2763107 RepID=A0A7G8BLH8_9BACT|nr:sensor histidine kinase [Alloacidobacterium dinghuense]QNI33398.1 sensor histidine kinase [Alloacidobacterium dinghuense]